MYNTLMYFWASSVSGNCPIW